MVVAEVPLWVVHQNAPDAAGPSNITTTTPASSSRHPDNANAPATDDDPNKSSLARAAQALAVWTREEPGRRSHKSAIYSVDCHPGDGSIFATGGGDGTVRLWNSRALFVAASGASSSSKKQRRHHGARFEAESGAYVSSSSSSSGEEDGDHDNEGEGKTTSDSDEARSEDTVHDLSSFVRRKKDGAASVTSPPRSNRNEQEQPSTPAQHQQAATSPSSPPSPHTRSSMSSSRHRLLATLSAHTGSSVLAVRFSTTGKYLASAGDDGAVCIYAPTTNSQSSIVATGNLVGAATSSQEHHHHHHHHHHWTRIQLCRGHGLDVVDLAWAPDDSHLVSCSLDSETPIIVWKLKKSSSSTGSNNFGTTRITNPFKILGKGIHTSTVKGISFDPAGSYLASSGDDPAVCIWRAHDDWGLERRIDASSGIFRRWKEDDSSSLSSQSLFRRICWSTDGAFVCSTNSVVKNKHVASTISREGWSVSSAQSSSAGAANLVGHKQPVVVSRNASQLLDARKKNDANDDNNNDGEPEYATLLALGDKRGFVTVWSTRKSRPIFKLQCSESRCTVTDLAWGRLASGDVMLLVSLLDGQVVALRFSVPDELGALLSKRDQARVFQLRYGIDVDDAGGYGQRLFVGENSAPKFIENALQMSLEDRNEDEIGVGDDDDDDDDNVPAPDDDEEQIHHLTPKSVKAQQKESFSQGKKRVRPVLTTVPADTSSKRSRVSTENDEEPKVERRKSMDPLENAMDAAEKASSAIKSTPGQSTQVESAGGHPAVGEDASRHPTPTRHHHRSSPPTSLVMPVSSIPHSTDRIHTVDLPVLEKDDYSLSMLSDQTKPGFTAECTNSSKVPFGSSGASIPCVDVSISQHGRLTWRDEIPGTSCSAITASRTLLAVGTVDGCVQLYGTSPNLGWVCGNTFRSHPPAVVGHPVVTLQLYDRNRNGLEEDVEMLVVTADGNFAVYSVLPERKLLYKGSIMPALTHMSLCSSASHEVVLPKLSRIQFTESGRLLMLLESQSSSNRSHSNEHSSSARGPTTLSNPGGSLQAFVYDRPWEVWMRVSDSRFVLSDFYSSLPSKSAAKGELSCLDDAVRIGSLASPLKAPRRGRLNGSDRQANAIYNQDEDDSRNFIATRSHCEDRMACALALRSASEFKWWLSLYVKTLAVSGHSNMLRMLVDMLLGERKDGEGATSLAKSTYCWLSSAPEILHLERKALLSSVIVPELSKNRALQRLTNEIAVDLASS